VAAIALVLGFAGSVAVGFAFERGSGDGLSPGALLALMLVSILSVLLFVCLFLMVARMMEGLAELVSRTGRLAEAMATLEAAQWDGSLARAGAGLRESLAGTGEPSLAAAPGRAASLVGAVETIRMGRFVKVTTPDGWMGWVRDTDLPPAVTPLPRTAAGVPYRPPLPSLSPGRPLR
jgi:hypothetical protein